MTVNALAPWIISFESDGQFMVKNTLTTNVKFGLKYAKAVHELVKVHPDYSIQQVFMAKVVPMPGARPMTYYLAFTSDSLPDYLPQVSNLIVPDKQVVIVQYRPVISCNHHSFECDSHIRLENVWAFWDSNTPAPYGETQSESPVPVAEQAIKKPMPVPYK